MCHLFFIQNISLAHSFYSPRQLLHTFSTHPFSAQLLFPSSSLYADDLTFQFREKVETIRKNFSQDSTTTLTNLHTHTQTVSVALSVFLYFESVHKPTSDQTPCLCTTHSTGAQSVRVYFSQLSFSCTISFPLSCTISLTHAMITYTFKTKFLLIQILIQTRFSSPTSFKPKFIERLPLSISPTQFLKSISHSQYSTEVHDQINNDLQAVKHKS